MRKTKSPARGGSRSHRRLKRAGETRIGISGWTHKPWRGVFYPPQHAQKRELFIYFDNDAKVHPSFDPQRLTPLLAA